MSTWDFSPENANSESTLSDMGSFLFRLPFEARRHLRPQTLPSLERTMAAAAFYVRCSSRAVSSLGMSSITS